MRALNQEIFTSHACALKRFESADWGTKVVRASLLTSTSFIEARVRHIFSSTYNPNQTLLASSAGQGHLWPDHHNSYKGSTVVRSGSVLGPDFSLHIQLRFCSESRAIKDWNERHIDSGSVRRKDFTKWDSQIGTNPGQGSGGSDHCQTLFPLLDQAWFDSRDPHEPPELSPRCWF